jgi:hypothetical protein
MESALRAALETGSDLVVIGMELNLLDSQFELVAGFDRFLSYQSLLLVKPEVGVRMDNQIHVDIGLKFDLMGFPFGLCNDSVGWG